MALTITDILSRNLFPGLELCAGADHASNAVTWVNIMEILDTTDSVKPGELLITTGYGLEDAAVYSSLIRRLKDRGISGIMIQPGYYIDNIPAFILKDADQYGLPILRIPPDYSFSDLLHVLISEIASDSGTLPVSGFDAARFEKRLADRLSSSPEISFTKKTVGQLVCILPVNGSMLNSPQITDTLRRISTTLSGRIDHCLAEIQPTGQAVFLFLSEDERAMSSLLHDLQALITSASEMSAINLCAGADQVSSPEDLAPAMQRALQCIALLRQIEAKRGLCCYEDYGFINNLGFIYRNCRSHLTRNQSFQLLLTRDRTRQTDFIDTLRVYLSENCNTSRAAERLFIHRHTLLNRLQTIHDISGIDLKSYYTRLWLSQTLLLHDYFGV